LSFQRPCPWADNKKPPTRARGPRESDTGSYPLARRRSSRRVTGFSRRPFGRLGDGSRPPGSVNQAVCGSGQPDGPAR
jgi:hypothetical protein